MLLAVRDKIMRDLGDKRFIFHIFWIKSSLLSVLQVLELDPFTLCPSSAEGREKEQLLQVICLVLAVFNMFVFSKLLYDYHQYKNTGKVPGIIYWTPFF